MAAALVAPASALASWSPPNGIGTSTDASPVAQGAFGGSVLTRGSPTLGVQAQRRRVRAPAALITAEPFESVWATGLAKDGDATRDRTQAQADPGDPGEFVAADGRRPGPARSPTTRTRHPAAPVGRARRDGGRRVGVA